MIMIGFSIFMGIAFFVLAYFLFYSIYLVRQAEVIIIERFGKFDRILGPGLHFIVPFIETTRKVLRTFIVPEDNGKRYYRFSKMLDRIDIREAVYDFPKQNVITKDNVTMEINALLYYQITDPKAAVYEVFNLSEAIEKLTQTTLRNVIGSLDLDESLVSRDAINERLRVILDEATDKWGVKINRVELQEVNPPRDIRQAMEKQMRAERDRRAVILEAEGRKRAVILDAEGDREAQVLSAKGTAESKVIKAKAEAEARLKTAQAEAKAIDMVGESVPGKDPLGYLIAMQYIKALPEITKDKEGKMIILPYETSSFIGAFASIKHLFEPKEKV